MLLIIVLPCVGGIPPGSTSSVHWEQKVLLSLSIGEGHSVCSAYSATACVSKEAGCIKNEARM